MTYIDLAEFRDVGYLQELNRHFLHPLGLALCLEVAADGATVLAGIWDAREDPDGMCFADGVLSADKRDRVDREWAARAKGRAKRLGYNVQPVEPTP